MEDMSEQVENASYSTPVGTHGLVAPELLPWLARAFAV